jgi:succinyl-diaminopimelate desuccinylase
VDVGNPARNVIPAKAQAFFNVRFNAQWMPGTITQRIRNVLDQAGGGYQLELDKSPSKSFLTSPNDWTALVQNAVRDITGKTAQYTTNGGTSDARFIFEYCPVVEYGGVNATIHQVNENTDMAVLEDLARVYERIIALYFAR